MTKGAFIREVGRRLKSEPLTREEAQTWAEDKCPIKSGEQIAIAVLWSREHRCRRWRNKRSNIKMERWLKSCMRRNGGTFYTVDACAARVMEHVFLLMAERYVEAAHSPSPADGGSSLSEGASGADADDTNVGRKREWISVDERLPEESAWYLVNIVNHFGLDFVTFTHYTKCYGWGVPNVTHWMPLPEPPKEN